MPLGVRRNRYACDRETGSARFTSAIVLPRVILLAVAIIGTTGTVQCLTGRGNPQLGATAET